MTDVFKLVCGSCVLTRSAGRWVVYWFGCRSKKHGVECEKKQGSNHVRLVLATRGGGEMGNY